MGFSTWSISDFAKANPLKTWWEKSITVWNLAKICRPCLSFYPLSVKELLIGPWQGWSAGFSRPAATSQRTMVLFRVFAKLCLRAKKNCSLSNHHLLTWNIQNLANFTALWSYMNPILPVPFSSYTFQVKPTIIYVLQQEYPEIFSKTYLEWYITYQLCIARYEYYPGDTS